MDFQWQIVRHYVRLVKFYNRGLTNFSPAGKVVSAGLPSRNLMSQFAISNRRIPIVFILLLNTFLKYNTKLTGAVCLASCAVLCYNLGTSPKFPLTTPTPRSCNKSPLIRIFDFWGYVPFPCACRLMMHHPLDSPPQRGL